MSQRQESASDDLTGSMEISVHPRLVIARFATPHTTLTGRHGAALVDALKGIVGAGGERFGLLADAAGVTGTDSDYRAATGSFFGQHRDSARIALVNLGPVIRVLAEMFRIGIRLDLRMFADEPAARAWLRAQGIDA